MNNKLKKDKIFIKFEKQLFEIWEDEYPLFYRRKVFNNIKKYLINNNLQTIQINSKCYTIDLLDLFLDINYQMEYLKQIEFNENQIKIIKEINKNNISKFQTIDINNLEYTADIGLKLINRETLKVIDKIEYNDYIKYIEYFQHMNQNEIFDFIRDFFKPIYSIDDSVERNKKIKLVHTFITYLNDEKINKFLRHYISDRITNDYHDLLIFIACVNKKIGNDNFDRIIKIIPEIYMSYLRFNKLDYILGTQGKNSIYILESQVTSIPGAYQKFILKHINYLEKESMRERLVEDNLNKC